MPISDFTITLIKSNDYLRCAVFLHGVAILVLLRSALPRTVIVVLLVLLIVVLLNIAKSRRPLPLYQKLTYHLGFWLLHEVGGRQTKYERLSIDFNGGIFMLLKLAGDTHHKILTVFNDQITSEQYRVLKFIAITKNKK